MHTQQSESEAKDEFARDLTASKALAMQKQRGSNHIEESNKGTIFELLSSDQIEAVSSQQQLSGDGIPKANRRAIKA